MKDYIEVEVYDNPVTIAVSAIVGISNRKGGNPGSVLTLLAPVYIAAGNSSDILYLDVNYNELLARIAEAKKQD